MPILYAFTLFVSASLLFMVQPMIGRMILPLLGGSPAAWNTCMVFFQTVLLLGYLYAHKLTAKLAPRQQVSLHLAVLLGAIGVMGVAAALSYKGSPIPVVESLAPDNTAYPMFGVLALLAVAIGIPFFAVSTSAPLLQRWFAYSGHAAARDPYFLYAASNAGSLISLLGYPLFTEPSFTLVQQAWLFAGGFVVLFALVALCGQTVRKGELTATAKPTTPPEPPPTLARRLRWLGLAFVPSSLMLGVTTHMTTDIASIPLLWVIPLALYLVTFIIAFAKTPDWFRPVLGNITPVVTLLLVFVLLSGESKIENVFYLLLLHLITYFLIALLCHSELARDRPSTTYLTNFYLWLSLGGMLGGVFNALLAPVLFGMAWEYPIAIAVGCILLPKLDDGSPPPTPEREGRNRLLDYAIPAAMFVILAVLTALTTFQTFGHVCYWLAEQTSAALQFAGLRIQLKPERIRDFILYAMPAMACFFFIDRPLRFGLCVAALLFVGYYRQDTTGIIAHDRSFFGIMKVEEEGEEVTRYGTDDGDYEVTQHINRRRLVHGTTLHGIQSTTETGVPGFLKLAGLSLSSKKFNNIQLLGGSDPWSNITKIGLWTAWDYKKEPLTYYHRTGPVGHIFDVTNSRYPRADFAMVGLGTGSVSCYAAAGQTVTFYEIDPDVKKMVAEDRKNFTFVKDAEARGATVKFVMGDARLKLQAEPDVRHKLLLVDAFSSDSIPIHLLTKQAVDLYLNRVVDDGVVALHISNRYIRLELAVAKIAEELGASALIFEDSWADNLQEFPPGKSQSTWVVLARKPETLAPFKSNKYTTSYRFETFDREPEPNRWAPMRLEPQLRVWTDDYADVLSIMRIKEVQVVRRWFGMPTFE
ncbi:fused MFS/spermidine synthase [Limnoglobus roseus]|uniref:Ferrichrome ABC transporter, permease protein n=1 Tax=Limnoglobus roseus TaxID=2598579 RepID=A0A5C1ASP9_9BACT|nr:fused MFS/spermidine synthase [Limnoglobus roseus]QEL21123.1 ferrichrome ABC transporter, permease protein [Limnoglobus roseus]